jgi:hypothetical protein
MQRASTKSGERGNAMGHPCALSVGCIDDGGPVVIAARACGFQLAMSLRQDGFAERICLSMTRASAVSAPPLSKAYLKGTAAGKPEFRPRNSFAIRRSS